MYVAIWNSTRLQDQEHDSVLRLAASLLLGRDARSHDSKDPDFGTGCCGWWVIDQLPSHHRQRLKSEQEISGSVRFVLHIHYERSKIFIDLRFCRLWINSSIVIMPSRQGRGL